MRHAIDRFEWDEWMHQSVTLYTPSLSPFLDRWKRRGTPYLARAHAAPSARGYATTTTEDDGGDDDESGEEGLLDGTMYSAFVSIPHSGALIEARERWRGTRSTDLVSEPRGTFFTFGSQ